MITLQQLIYFRELAKTEHLTQTAESLCIAQTTLSTTIINLEKQLHIQLFDRVGRNMRLSAAGKLYLSYVNTALNALENGEKAMNDYAGKVQKPVTVAMTSSNIWQNLIKGFMKEYPGYSIRQAECSRDSFRTLLLDEQVDFVFAGTSDFPAKGLEHTVIYRDDVYLSVPKNHRLAGRKEIRLKEAEGETFIDLPKSSSFRYFCDRMFEQAGIEHHAEMECDYMIRGQLVEAGFGVALITNLSYWKNVMSNDCTYVLITDPFAVRELSLFWNPHNYLTGPARDFRNYVLETYSQKREG